MSVVKVVLGDLCDHAQLIPSEVWRVAKQVDRACSVVNMPPKLELYDEPPRLILEWPRIGTAYFMVSITKPTLRQSTREGVEIFDHSEESIKDIANRLDVYFNGPK